MIDPRPVTLEGHGVRLEPLSQEHAEGLARACADGQLWDLWFTQVPRPEEVPANSASSRASRRAIASDSSVDTATTSSTSAGSHSGGVRPMPMPSMRCAPGARPSSTEDSAGSRTTIRTPGLCRLLSLIHI